MNDQFIKANPQNYCNNTLSETINKKSL